MSNKSDNIYKKLEEKIISGEYKPGERIPTESELCTMFKVSRTSVRQALERLVVLGLLYKRQGSGTYVNMPNIIATKSVFSFILFQNDTISEILEFCKILESGTATMASKNRTDKNLKKMKKHLQIMNDNISDIGRFYAAVLLFHVEMARASLNPIVLKVYQMLKVTAYKWNINNKILQSSAERILKEHTNLLSALEENDTELVEHTCKKIIVNFAADISPTSKSKKAKK